MLIIGDREQEANKVAVRTRGNEDLGAIEISEFINKIISDIESKL